MLAEWTAECADDAPTIVVPWSDAASGLHFVDLRAEPYDIAEISEAEHYPALSRALRSLNASRSPFLTSKCDAWPLQPDELSTLTLELDAFFSETETPAGYASYIDLLHRDRGLFLSAGQHQTWLDRFTRRAARLEHSEARVECVLRPALYEHRGTVLEGFGLTLYVFALGPDAATALRSWELALEDTVALLRNREFEIPRMSATIDPA